MVMDVIWTAALASVTVTFLGSPQRLLTERHVRTFPAVVGVAVAAAPDIGMMRVANVWVMKSWSLFVETRQRNPALLRMPRIQMPTSAAF